MRTPNLKGIALGMLLAAALGLGIDVAAQTGLLYAVRIRWDAGPWDLSGTGDPESNIRAPQGSIYRRTNGLIYRKSTSISTTGWKDLANIASLTSSVSNNALAATDGSGVVSWSTAVDPVMTGSGTPNGSVTAAAGRLYRDTATGLIYWKASGSGNTGWSSPISSLAALITNTANSAIAMTDGSGTPSWTTAVEPFLTGSGAPEGAQTAVVGRVYRDTATGLLYRKQTGSGNTGWSAALSDIASLITNTANTAMAMTNGSGLASWTTGVEPIYTGSGNPQGVVSAALGREYRNTANGYRYVKLGGGSTAYGWYLEPNPGRVDGPLPFYAELANNTTSNPAATSTGFGAPFNSGAALFTLTGQSGGRTLISGKRFNFVSSGNATINTVGGITTESTNPSKFLDDDLDLWVYFQTDQTAVTTARYYFGFSISSFTDLIMAPTYGGATTEIAIRYCSDGNGTWEGITNNGTTSRSITTTLGSVASNTVYRLRIRFIRQGGTPTVYFSVNDGTEVSTTTKIPATGTNAFMSLFVDQIAASNRAFAWRAFGGMFGS